MIQKNALLNLQLINCIFILGIISRQETARYENYFNERESYFPEQEGAMKCIDSMGSQQACYPPFMMLSAGKKVSATNTCGMNGRPEKYCYLIPSQSPDYHCSECNPYENYPDVITDKNPNTWWQSQTLFINKTIHFEQSVNLTIDLGARMHLAYLTLTFKNEIPSAMVIYKRLNSTEEWKPWGYFSSHCYNYFNMPGNNDYEQVRPFDKIICSEAAHYKQDQQIIFLVTKGRINPEEFYLSEEYKEWASAKEVMIELKKMYTMGDEKNAEDDTLHMYYYSVSQLSIGGRCDCNGHGSKCRDSTGSGRAHMVCECEHNTEGDNCERCKIGYMDVPWRAADRNSPFECKQCQCNGNADICRFDEELFKETGSGGVCVDCKYNTQGIHCEECLPGHYPDPEHLGRCKKCECSPIGTTTGQGGEPVCNEKNGQCPCKPGVAGLKCDRCGAGYYAMGAYGCKSCECSAEGTLGNSKACDPITGSCNCKPLVTGDKCDKCALGSFGLLKNDPLGCKPCNCSQLASVCEVNQAKINEYAQTDITDLNELIESDKLILNCPAGMQPCKVCKNKEGEPIIPCQANREGIYECLCSKDTKLCPYCEDGLFELQTDFRFEKCECPNLYTGDNCEKCIAGYRRDPPNGPPYSRCVPCTCNGNGDTCDPITGQCNCRDNTGGIFCDRCEDGYYSSELSTAFGLDCKPCPCPEGTKCMQVANEVVCLDCPNNRSGKRCEKCSPNFFGDPNNGVECKPCQCNGNINLEDENNCNDKTGVCTKCQFDTTGDHCEKCKPGYRTNYKLASPDDPTAEQMLDETGLQVYMKPIRGCRPCNCDPLGSLRNSNNEFSCVEKTGKCACKPGVEGTRCEKCKIGYYGFNSGTGCKKCECNMKGSRSEHCDQLTGQCSCFANVVGKKCDSCAPEHWRMLPLSGCEPCNCNYYGSENQKCDQITGACVCKAFANGLKCDKCKENHYDLQRGCLPCDTCYNLIQDGVVNIRKDLDTFMNSSNTFNSEEDKLILKEIKANLTEIKTDISKRYDEIVANIGKDTTIVDEGQFKRLVNTMDTLTKELETTLVSSQSYKPPCDYSNFANTLSHQKEQRDKLNAKLNEINERLEKMPIEEIEGFSTPAKNFFHKARKYSAEKNLISRQEAEIIDQLEAMEREALRLNGLLKDTETVIEQRQEKLSNLYRQGATEDKIKALEKLIDDLKSRESKLTNDLMDVEKNRDKLDKVDVIGTDLKEVKTLHDSLRKSFNTTKESYDLINMKLEKIKSLIQANELKDKPDVDAIIQEFNRLGEYQKKAKNFTLEAERVVKEGKENYEKLSNFDAHIQSSKAEFQDKIIDYSSYKNQLSYMTKEDGNELDRAEKVYQKAKIASDYYKGLNGTINETKKKMNKILAGFEAFDTRLNEEASNNDKFASLPSESLVNFNKIKSAEDKLTSTNQKNQQIDNYLVDQRKLKENLESLKLALNNQGQEESMYESSLKFKQLDKEKQGLIDAIKRKKEKLELLLNQKDFLANELREFVEHEKHLKLIQDRMVVLKSSTSSIYQSKLPETNK